MAAPRGERAGMVRGVVRVRVQASDTESRVHAVRNAAFLP